MAMNPSPSKSHSLTIAFTTLQQVKLNQNLTQYALLISNKNTYLDVFEVDQSFPSHALQFEEIACQCFPDRTCKRSGNTRQQRPELGWDSSVKR